MVLTEKRSTWRVLPVLHCLGGDALWFLLILILLIIVVCWKPILSWLWSPNNRSFGE